MRSIIRRICSMLMSLVMLFEISGVTELSAIASDDETQDNIVYITEEIDGRREEAVKHFRLTDGRNIAVQYTEGVHYEVDGVWQNIDNTLVPSEYSYPVAAEAGEVLSEKTSGSAGAEDTEPVPDAQPQTGETVQKEAESYTNTANEFLVQFPATYTPGSRMEISSGEYSVFIGLEDTENESKAEIRLLEDISAAENFPEIALPIRSSATYSGLYDGTDAEYLLISRRLKENIIISAPEYARETYSYLLSSPGLTPELGKDGSVSFITESGESAFTVTAPVLYDSYGMYCGDIPVTLQTLSGGEYRLIYSLPGEWLLAEDRVYPVTFDPVIYSRVNTSYAVDDTIASCDPGTNYGNWWYTYCGYDIGTSEHTTFYNSRILLRFTRLPVFADGEVIVDAEMFMTGWNSFGTGINVSAHAITESWDADTVCWNSRPDAEEAVVDTQNISSVHQTTYCWKLTELVKRWYADNIDGLPRLTNYGVMFRSDTEDHGTDNYVKLESADHNYGGNPHLVIYYTNISGLEDYLDYTAQSMGAAGTAYVQDFSGSLNAVRSDMSYSGNRMPVDLSFTYNFEYKDTDYGYGNGWRCIYAQRCNYKQDAEHVHHYEWMDGDGTVLYFHQSGGVWTDDSGLGYVLTSETTIWYDTYFTITSKDGLAYRFDAYGRLQKIYYTSAPNSYIQISYTEGSWSNYRISEIKDGAGRKYTFSYSGNRLASVSYKGAGSTALETVTYTYSDGDLTAVTRHDGKTVLYTYTDHRMVSASDIAQSDGTRDTVLFSYYMSLSDPDLPVRVKKVEYYSHDTFMTSAEFVYGVNFTTVTDNNGRYSTYQFNNYANTSAVYNSFGQAVYGEYSRDSSSSARANELISASRLQDTVVNLLPSDGYTGQVSVTAGETYTLSGEIDGNGKLYVTAGSETYYGEDVSSAEPEKHELTVVIPDGVSSVTAGFTGSGTCTCLQFEKAEAASRYNMIPLSDFQSGTDGWTGSGTTAADGTCTVPGVRAKLDTNALKMTGDLYTDKNISREFEVSGAAGDTYTFGIWILSNSVPLNNEPYPGAAEERSCGIRVRLYSGTVLVNEKYVGANDACREWQFISDSIQAEGSYTRIEYTVCYGYNGNTSYFDGPQLFSESFADIYTYNAAGNVETVTDINGNVTTYTYGNNNSDVTKISLPSGAEYSYTYNSSRLLTRSVSAEGVTSDYSYNSNGLSTGAAISAAGETRRISSSVSYTADDNMTASVTTGDRNTVTYANNTDLSQVNSVTDARGNTTAYTYDSMGRPLTSTSGGSTVTNAYSDDRLSTVSHTNAGSVSTEYSLNYTLGDLTESVKVGGRTLAEYSYTEGTWLTEEQQYGNGDNWEYGYDETDTLISKENESGTRFLYFYNNEGNPARTEKYSGNSLESVQKFYYDGSDRLIRFTEQDASGTTVHDSRCSYDVNENINSVTENVCGEEFTYSYGYDDDKRPESTEYGDVSSETEYDGYGRVSGRSISLSDEAVLETEYTYRSIDSTYTTTQVSSLETDFGDGTESYSYTYDANGNILTVTHGEYLTEYEYDSLNQLELEYNEEAGKAWEYSYDPGGNILSVTEYDCERTADGWSISNPVTVTYSYGDSDWGDLLTAYGNEQISYDGIGNPLSYRGWTFRWEGGRQLTGAAKDGQSLSFRYNDSGLRTEKNTGTGDHSYYWNGSTLTADITDEYGLYFHYDSSGEILGFTYRSGNTETEYFYVKDLQGDVIRVLDSNGNTAAEYSYDAWGRMLSSSGTLADINPIRYRGYYFDSETGLYYLQSRYYDPDTCRFINADTFANTGDGILGSNMFAYCGNNSVSCVDSSGRLFVADDLLCATAAIVVMTTIIGCFMLADALSSEDISSSYYLIWEDYIATHGLTRKNDGKIYTVYYLQNQYGEIAYIGRVKTQNLNSRIHHHEITRKLVYSYSVSGLTYEEARALEEQGMLKYNTLTGKFPNNMIHGISPSNPKAPLYFFDLANYLSNRAENTILNLIN